MYVPVSNGERKLAVAVSISSQCSRKWSETRGKDPEDTKNIYIKMIYVCNIFKKKYYTKKLFQVSIFLWILRRVCVLTVSGMDVVLEMFWKFVFVTKFWEIVRQPCGRRIAWSFSLLRLFRFVGRSWEFCGNVCKLFRHQFV